ncbi:MAG TPA: hypothetical protein VF620_13505 [Allosphingosinicella sp.]|jgi:hypothetical protein
MAGLQLDTLAVTKRLTAAGMDSRQAQELAEALTEQAVDLYLKIKDVEIRSPGCDSMAYRRPAPSS